MAGLLFILLIVTIVAEIAMPFLMYGLAPGFDAVPEKFDLVGAAHAHHDALPAVHVARGADVGRAEFSRPLRRKLFRLDRAQRRDDGRDAVLAVARASEPNPKPASSRPGACSSQASCSSSLLIWGMRRDGLTLGFRRPRMTDDVRHLIRLGVPGVISGGVTQINIAIGTVIASLQPGAVSQLYYADRVYELPLAIVGIAIGIVLLPDVSRQLRAGNHGRRHGQPEPLARVRACC